MSERPIVPIFTHGVEFNDGFDRHFASDMHRFISGIFKYTPKDIIKRINPIFTNWNAIVSDREKETFRRTMEWRQQHVKLWMKLSYMLTKRIIKALCYGGTDILWYSNTQRGAQKGDIYKEIHDLIEGEMDRIAAIYKDNSPIFVSIPHSQGTQIMLNHCFISKHEITGLITLGSPIWLASGRFHNWGEPPAKIRFWRNFVNILDPISHPISINPNPAFQIVEDIPVAHFTKQLPILAHTSYWDDKKVHQGIAEKLAQL